MAALVKVLIVERNVGGGGRRNRLCFVHEPLKGPSAFAGKFLRCINAKFAADGDFARGVVEHTGVYCHNPLRKHNLSRPKVEHPKQPFINHQRRGHDNDQPDELHVTEIAMKTRARNPFTRGN